MSLMKNLWVRRLASFEEEAAADAEFWARMTGDERVAVVNQMRREAAMRQGLEHDGLRRVVRVTDDSRR